MGIFDQLKDLKKLKDIQDSFAKERFSKEKEGIKVVIDGNMEIKEIVLNELMDKARQEQLLKECINEVMREAKTEMAKNLSGFNL